MVNGRFYYKLTNSGNLIGEFSNQTSDSNFAESATRTTPFEPRNFNGTYNTTWYEENTGQAYTLVIDSINNYIFELTWTNQDGVKIFFGEAFIVDDILIGNYWDKELNDLKVISRK